MITRVRAAVIGATASAALIASCVAHAIPIADAGRSVGADRYLVQYYYPYGPGPYYGPYPYYAPPPPPNYYAPPPPQAPPAPQATCAPPPQFWYYCDDPKGYYPQVQNCPTPWREVSAPPPKKP
jgi:hypothetical protein